MSRDDLAATRLLLTPKSIAVIGASRQPGTIGRQVLHNLIAHGFTGAVYPVNPHASSVCAVRAYRSILETPEPIDVAVIVVPKEQVVDVAEECAKAGVSGLVVITAGFRETGADGAAREAKLLEIVRSHRMRMIGPNCLGIVNADPAISMNATFADAMPPFGHAAFVSQSGALGVSVLDFAREYGIGISQFVSVGNKADVSGNDLLLAWEHDPMVKAILMYVENFGNPTRFLEIASRITKHKPIVVVKSGRSRAGARAASSHTGALAASDTAVDALLTQSGVLRAATIEELFDIAMAFEARAIPRSRRTAVLTNAGGPGILAADAMEAAGLELPELSQPTVDALRPLLPPEASLRNPVDMIASATPAGYRQALTALLADPAIDAVVPIFVPPFGVKQPDIADAVVGAASTGPDKTVLAVLMGREGLPQGRSELHAAGIPAYIFPESAARALAALNRHAEWSARPPARRTPIDDIDRDGARAIIDAAAREHRDHLTQVEALSLLEAYEIPTARARLATSADEAVAIAKSLGGPVALKISSPDIEHKADVDGVKLGLSSERDIRDAYASILDSVAARAPAARVGGVLVQQMLRGGRETIVGVARDPAFGPLVMFGLGGTLVEATRDVVFRIAPLDDDQAETMTRAFRAALILDAWRGNPPVDRDALVSVIRRVGQLACDYPSIAELDVNPLLAGPSSAVALDARVRLESTP